MRYVKALLIGLFLGAITLGGLVVSLPKYTPKNSVVRIENYASTGSGVVVKCWQTDSGFYNARVYTVAHMVMTPIDRPKIEVFYPNGGVKRFRSRVIHYNRKIDFAVLLIEYMSEPLPTVKTPDTSTFYKNNRADDKIYVVGCSLGNRPFTKLGKINWMMGEEGKIRPLFISVDAHVIFGDSGGGVFNEDGELIGLLSSISVIGFGIPHKEIAYAVPFSLIDESLRLTNQS